MVAQNQLILISDRVALNNCFSEISVWDKTQVCEGIWCTRNYKISQCARLASVRGTPVCEVNSVYEKVPKCARLVTGLSVVCGPNNQVCGPTSQVYEIPLKCARSHCARWQCTSKYLSVRVLLTGLLIKCTGPSTSVLGPYYKCTVLSLVCEVKSSVRGSNYYSL